MAKTLIRPTSRSQATLPKAIRQKLNVDVDTFLDVMIEGKNIILRPVQFVEVKDIREYSDGQVTEFLKEDGVSKENAEFANKLLSIKTNNA